MRRIALSAALWGTMLVSARAQATLVTRVAVTQAGDFLIVGNTSAQDCNAGVPAPIVGVVGNCGTSTADTSPDVLWSSNATTATASTSVTTARTTAVLSLPAGTTLTHAYLYWAAIRSGQAFNHVTLDAPGGFSGLVNAIDSHTVTYGGSDYYVAVSDVTSQILAYGAGAYSVTNTAIAPLANVDQDVAFAGWWMVVLYADPSAPLRRLAIYDGIDVVSPGTPSVLPVTGFQFLSGGGTSKLGVIGLDGDEQTMGDSLKWDGTFLNDAVNPVDNFFNSTRSTMGTATSVAGDLPQLTGGPRSMSEIDLDTIDITYAVGVGTTSATLTALTTDDVYMLGGVVVSIPTTPACNADAQCGTTTSGKVCNPGTNLCQDGCRGLDGNGCPSGETCSSINTSIGDCTPQTTASSSASSSSSSASSTTAASSGAGGAGGAGGATTSTTVSSASATAGSGGAGGASSVTTGVGAGGAGGGAGGAASSGSGGGAKTTRGCGCEVRGEPREDALAFALAGAAVGACATRRRRSARASTRPRSPCSRR